jgi:hypothetical protein
MKHSILPLITAIVLAIPASALAIIMAPSSNESYVKIHNDTDTMVWITAYSPRLGGDKIEGSWPVHAHSYDEHGLRINIVDVRAEIDAAPCSGGNKLNSLLGTRKLGVAQNGATVRELVGYVRFSGGHCIFTT